MEADIIVEGFLQSVPMHKVKYARMIGDGDMNVYLKVLESRPYDDITVQKIECRNHLLRNLFNKLRDLVKDSKSGFRIENRKVLGSCLQRLRAAIDKASKYWREQHVTQKAKFKTRKNAPYNVFGSHSDCQDYFCNKKRSGEVNYVPKMKEDGIFNKIKKCLSIVEDNVYSVLLGANNNTVEHFNSKILRRLGESG